MAVRKTDRPRIRRSSALPDPAPARPVPLAPCTVRCTNHEPHIPPPLPQNRLRRGRGRRGRPGRSPAAPAAPAGRRPRRTATDVAAGKADTPRMTIAMVTHAPSGDTFWDIIRKGAEAAAAKDNVKLIYSNDENAGRPGQPGPERDRPEGRRHRRHPRQAGRHEGRGRQGGEGRHPGRRLQLRHGRLEGAGPAVVLRPGRVRRRPGLRRASSTRPAPRTPSAWSRTRATSAWRRAAPGVKKTFKGKTENLYVNGTDMPSVQVDHHRQAQAGLLHRPGRHARRPVRADRRAVRRRRGQQGEGRHLRPQQGPGRRRQGAATSSSPSTSSPTCRATSRSTRSGSTRTTATSSAAAGPVLTGPAFVDKDNVDADREVRREGHTLIRAIPLPEHRLNTPACALRPSPEPAPPKGTPMTTSGKPLSVAVIGAGMAGRSHAAGYRNVNTVFGAGLPPVRLAAIADANVVLGEDAARRYGFEKALPSWEAVVEDPTIDAVSIVVGNDPAPADRGGAGRRGQARAVREAARRIARRRPRDGRVGAYRRGRDRRRLHLPPLPRHRRDPRPRPARRAGRPHPVQRPLLVRLRDRPERAADLAVQGRPRFRRAGGRRLARHRHRRVRRRADRRGLRCLAVDADPQAARCRWARSSGTTPRPSPTSSARSRTRTPRPSPPASSPGSSAPSR